MEFSVSDAARKLGLSRAGIIKAIKAGHLRAEWHGKNFRIKDEALAHYAANRPRRGRTEIYSKKERERIVETAKLSPKLLGYLRWTLESLRAHTKTKMSTGLISALLIEAGIRDTVLTSHRGRRPQNLE